MKRLSVAIALHNHQPVGNFGWVLEQIYEDSYLPMVAALEAHPRVKVALHYTGHLLDWLREWHPDLVERVAALVARGQVEVLGGAYFEPILPSIPDRDKALQLTRLRDTVEECFGRRPSGLWLAERVWEASLARPLAEAGYGYTILDDSHFAQVGLAEDELFRPFLTEDQGYPITLLATGTKMRYLIPWRSVEECLAYFRETASEEPRLVLMGDDGEKFGGWPTTATLCWKEGWVERFFEMLEANSDWLEVVLPGDYVGTRDARGPVYLPAGSYPEMLKWSGGFWRNFIARYPEVNAMHKKMLRVSDRVEAAGSPLEAVTHLLRGQANDAYWHGVFGGVYLPHLRSAVWRNLLAAERAVSQSEGELRLEVSDYDLDGSCELLLEAPAQNAYLSPAQGGALVEWDVNGRNAADCIARREEPYHKLLREGTSGTGVTAGAEPLRVREKGLEKRLHYDTRRRLVFQAYLVARGATVGQAVRSRLPEVGHFAAGAFELKRGATMERAERVAVGRRSVLVRMAKSFRVSASVPELELNLTLTGEASAIDLLLVVEANLGLPGGVADGSVAGLPLDRPADLGPRTEVALRQPVADVEYRLQLPRGGRAWYYPIETVNNSDSGYERIVQGACLLAVHPVRIGATPVKLRYRLRSPT
jgi:4-alpha-glucanotransferase